MSRRPIPTFVLVFLISAASCISVQHSTPEAVPAPAPAPRAVSENLDATLWMQTAAEYRALTTAVYAAGERQLDTALADPAWTAIEGVATEGKKPAVIVDVDETILDNSYYQARLIRDGKQFDGASWEAWVDEARCTPIPGAVEFARYAAEHGVTMIYLTNRNAGVEEAATRRNLETLGFPIDESTDTVLTRGEKPEWSSSDKESRRQYVAERYRVLLMFGDDLGDFLPNVKTSIDDRAAMVRRNAAMWGTRWLVLPNPTYGSWMQSVLGNRRGLTRDQVLDAKTDALDTRR